MTPHSLATRCSKPSSASSTTRPIQSQARPQEVVIRQLKQKGSPTGGPFCRSRHQIHHRPHHRHNRRKPQRRKPCHLLPRAAHNANPISTAGPTPIATAPKIPPGTLNGLANPGSFTRSTTSATNSSINLAPYNTRSIEISRSNDSLSASAHATEHSTTLTHGTPTCSSAPPPPAASPPPPSQTAPAYSSSSAR